MLGWPGSQICTAVPLSSENELKMAHLVVIAGQTEAAYGVVTAKFTVTVNGHWNIQEVFKSS